MSRSVIYLMSGAAHVPYLLVSLQTLRRHWGGPIEVHAWPDSLPTIAKIHEDRRIGPSFDLVPRRPEYRGHCDQFLDKIRLAQSLGEHDSVLYLDADTTVHGPVGHLFDMAEEFGFCATQWNDWVSNRGAPRSRILSLAQYPAISRAFVDLAANGHYPSVNGGVWAARPGSPVLEQWRTWTEASLSTFICDEKCLHLCVAKFGPTQDLHVATGGRWNCSPKFQPAGLHDEEVIVRHYHGDSNVRPDKSRKGFDLWWPLWRDCLEINLGGCRDWRKECGNKWLNRLEREGF